MKRRLILHMGLPKTGSTSIQSFLRQNPAALAASSAHYPLARAEAPPAKRGAQPYIEREVSHALLGHEIKRRGDAADPAQTPLWLRALARIEESGAATGVISYEHLSTQPRLYRYEPLRRRLADFQVTGLIYLRDPEAWAVSLYGQSLRRRGRPRISFAEFLAETEIDGRFSRLLDTLQSHAPLDDLLAADFETAARNGLVRDFLAGAGIRGEAEAAASEHLARNNSLPVAALLFILRCNRANLPEAVATEVRKALRRAAAAGELPALPPGLGLATQDERRALRQAAAIDAERLERRHGVVITQPPAEPPGYRPFEASDFVAVAEALAPRLSSEARTALRGVAPSRGGVATVSPAAMAAPAARAAIKGEAVRLVIWDLDETFWRGTLTEGGIAWREDAAEIVRELARRGIMSTICSKNDLQPVKRLLWDQGVWESFIFPSIDWAPKGPRIRRLIETIQLRAPSVLFIDDSAHNREEASAFAPGIQVAPETVIASLLDDPRLVGKDDHELTRLKQYKVLETREAEMDHLRETGAEDSLAFLRASDIRVRIESDVEANLDRAIELINRTNQLNFTKWRLPEDLDEARVKLRGQISHFATQAGLIQVTDKYGDYGYCGYFQVTTRRDLIQLQQFCFSCRILDMGVEAFVHQRLGRPALTVKGAVLSDPVNQPPVDWIRMEASEPRLEGQTVEAPPLGSMAARGGCVLWPLTHYFRLSASKVVGEFNTVRDGKLIRLDHSLCLRHALLGVTAEQADAVAPLGYLPQDFHTEFFEFEGPKPLWVFSSWVDAGLPVYRHRRTGMTIPFEPAEPDDRGDSNPAIDAYVAAEFERVTYGEAEYRRTLELVFSRVPPHGLMFVLLSDTPNARRQERNRWCAGAAAGRDNVRLLRLSDFVGDPSEILNAQSTHFDRKVYHRLYMHMIEQARASFAEDRASAAAPETAPTAPARRSGARRGARRGRGGR